MPARYPRFREAGIGWLSVLIDQVAAGTAERGDVEARLIKKLQQNNRGKE